MAAPNAVRTVVAERRGLYLKFRNLPEPLYQPLCSQLTYNKVVLPFGRGQGARTSTVPRICYAVETDPDGVFAPSLVTAAGFYPRLKNFLEGMNWRLEWKDCTEYPRPEALIPDWSALANIEFRAGQRECLEQITRVPFGRIVAATGYGKSWLMAMICRLYPKARFDITTFSQDVLQDLHRRLLEFCPGVGIVCSREKRNSDARIVCYSLKSLQHSRGQAEFLLGDEIHEAATDDNLRRFGRYSHARMFGFSAQDIGDRIDKADFELEGAFGPVLFRMDYVEGVDKGVVVPIVVQWVDVCLDMSPIEGLTMRVSKLRHGYWRNMARNGIIAEQARQHSDKQVLITVETVEHALFLKHQLPEFEVVYAEGGLKDDDREKYISWGILSPDHPEMTIARRTMLKRQFESGELRGAIATTVWKRGVNFEQLEVEIRADGSESKIDSTQLPGRLSRIYDGKQYGLLIDFNDQFSTYTERRANKRRRIYRDLGWMQLDPVRSGFRQQLMFGETPK